MNSLNQYKVMWVMVLFDLPTETKKDRKIYSDFRKKMLKDGFVMFQFSIYLRHCPSRDNAQVHIKRVMANLPPRGEVAILQITDKQFGNMQVYYGKKETEKEVPHIQLQLF